MNEREIFDKALSIGNTAERSNFLDRACSHDAPLRERVKGLIAAHDQLGGFLESAAVAVTGTCDEPLGEQPGNMIGPYRLLEKIGEGGFGIVFMAEQMRPMRRRVALKIVKPGMDSRQIIARFEAERQALALMDHANIARVFDAGATESGRPYFVMELVRGVPITEYCDQHQLSVRERLELFIAICHAVQHAHQKGIIHRDIKPTNVLVTLHDGTPVPKVIDFGVAKALSGQLTDKTLFTGFAQMIGTPLYMSPEQTELSGLDVDTRSDVYSLGVLLYELLTGSTPFEKQRFQGVGYDEMRRIIREEEPAKPSTRLSTLGQLASTVVTRRHSDLPALIEVCRGELDWVAMKALEKDRRRRYEMPTALAADVQRYLDNQPVEACPPSLIYRFRKFSRRNRAALTTAALIAVALLVGAGVSIWEAQRATQAETAKSASEAKTEALGQIPVIEAHLRAQRYHEAFTRLQQIEPLIGDDPRLEALRSESSWVLSIETEPSGVTVSRKLPDASLQSWEQLGVTPIKDVRLARGIYRWKFEKPGYVTAEGLAVECPLGPALFPAGGTVHVDLDPVGVAPPEMARVQPLAPGFFWRGRKIDLPPYWMDRFEVTNRQFKQFVDAGGYRRKEFWDESFEKDGKPISWDEAMTLFHDETGHTGPATWSNGTYEAGRDDLPVSGVSWYEAAAFAKFAGKKLPTIYHWSGASGRVFVATEIIPRSNFGGFGPARVGQYQGLSPRGIYDMAGNVKEWCSNSAGEGKRYILGGAWDEKEYMFTLQDARAPIDRDRNMGFRCVKYMSDHEPPKEAFEESKPQIRDFRNEKLLSDDEFKIVRGLYAYNHIKPLNASVERREATPLWIHELVTVDAAYGNERLPIHIFLPTENKPPYEPVIYWPGGGALYVPTIASPTDENVAFLIKSGRALVWPVYKGMYERKQPQVDMFDWEASIQEAKDLGRTIDYLETRRGELNAEATGYYGYSWGAAHAVRAVAIDDRIKAAVFVDGGLLEGPFERPERDPVNYLPRITIPVLMLNGIYDSLMPVRESQEPMFQLLGTDPARKRYIASGTGHVAALSNERTQETITWFDKWLGPVPGNTTNPASKN